MQFCLNLQYFRINLFHNLQDRNYHSILQRKCGFLWNCATVVPFYWVTVHKEFFFIACVLVALFLPPPFFSVLSFLIFCVSHTPFNHICIYIFIYLIMYLLDRGKRWHSCLRHCATSRITFSSPAPPAALTRALFSICLRFVV